MKEILHSLVIPGQPKIGPLLLSELRERLRKERRSTENATVVIHASLGDQFMPLRLYQELRIATLPPECAVICPHCEALQPRRTPGKHKCVRCGANLIIDENYKAELATDPTRPWKAVSLVALVGLIVFLLVVPNEIGLWSSWTICFGVPAIAMIRQGVVWTNGYKSTARHDPVTYGLAVLVTGAFTILAS